MLSGDNGLLKRAGDARDDTVVGQEKEQVELAYLSAAVKKLGNDVDEEDLRTELNNSVGAGKTTVSTNGDDTLNVNFTDTKHNYIVDGGTVTRTADGEVEVVPTGKVAKIGTTFYETLQDAFDAVPKTNTETTITLLKNVSENVFVVGNQQIVLDLNGKTITNIEGNSQMNSDNPQPVIEILSGNIEVKNGTILANYGYSAIENYGTLTISSGTYNSSVYQTIYNEGVLNITGGEFSCNDTAIFSWSGTVNINNGTFTGRIYGLSCYEGAYARINGGTFTASESYGVYASGLSTVVDIYNGVFSGVNYDLKADSGVINVYGGSYSTSSGNVILN